MQDRLSRVQANVAKQLLLYDLVPTIESDFAEYNAFIERAPAWNDKGLALTDPDYNTLGPHNSFWISIRDRHQDIIACAAQRVWNDTRFVDLVNQGRLLYDGTKTKGGDTLHLFADGMGHLEGNIGYMGGGWVHPDHRGNAFPMLMITLAQAKLLQDYDVDYIFSIVRPVMIEKGLAHTTYRYYHMDYGATMWRAKKQERLEVWILHNTRADLEREMSYWLTAPG